VKALVWIALVIPALAADVVACVAAPFLGLLVNDRGRLPAWLRWFETPDNTAFGDAGHHERWNGRPLYPRFVAWFWRNKAYTFSTDVLGARTRGPVTALGNPSTGDRPLVEGWCLWRTPEGYWQLYVVRRWAGRFFLRLNLGWKLWDLPNGANAGQYVCSVNPLKRTRCVP